MMRNIEIFPSHGLGAIEQPLEMIKSIGRSPTQTQTQTQPSKHMYTYLSLVKRKEAELFHNIDRGH